MGQTGKCSEIKFVSFRTQPLNLFPPKVTSTLTMTAISYIHISIMLFFCLYEASLSDFGEVVREWLGGVDRKRKRERERERESWAAVARLAYVLEGISLLCERRAQAQVHPSIGSLTHPQTSQKPNCTHTQMHHPNDFGTIVNELQTHT